MRKRWVQGEGGVRWPGRQSIYTHTQPGYAAGNTHTQDTRTGTAWGYTRAERPAHTVSLVYISEVPWPPPSVTTSYIPLCPPTPPPGRLHLLLLFFLLLLLLLLLPLSAQAFLICIPLRWHSSPPLDPPSVVSFASSSPNDAIHPTTPVVRLARFHAHACPSSVYHAYDAGVRGDRQGWERQRERPPLTSAHGVRRPRDTK